MSVTCGNRSAHVGGAAVRHASVDSVRACFAGMAFLCSWLVRRGWNEDGEEIIEDCGALAFETARGWHCEAGHAHVAAEVRHAEGWEYAHDEIEAERMERAGVAAVREFF